MFFTNKKENNHQTNSAANTTTTNQQHQMNHQPLQAVNMPSRSFLMVSKYLIIFILVCGCSFKDYDLNPTTTVFNQLIKGINDKSKPRSE